MNPDFVRVDLRNSIWEIPKRYRDLTMLGSGAYGLVCSAVDNRNNQEVAIKKISAPFQTAIHAKRTYREIKLLKHMKHDNVSFYFWAMQNSSTYLFIFLLLAGDRLTGCIHSININRQFYRSLLRKSIDELRSESNH